MYTSTGFTVTTPNGHTSTFKTPSTGDAINTWKASQKEVEVKWPTDRKDIAPNRKESEVG